MPKAPKKKPEDKNLEELLGGDSTDKKDIKEKVKYTFKYKITFEVKRQFKGDFREPGYTFTTSDKTVADFYRGGLGVVIEEIKTLAD